jgi:hypothetical protein
VYGAVAINAKVAEIPVSDSKSFDWDSDVWTCFSEVMRLESSEDRLDARACRIGAHSVEAILHRVGIYCRREGMDTSSSARAVHTDTHGIATLAPPRTLVQRSEGACI